MNDRVILVQYMYLGLQCMIISLVLSRWQVILEAGQVKMLKPVKEFFLLYVYTFIQEEKRFLRFFYALIFSNNVFTSLCVRNIV